MPGREDLLLVLLEDLSVHLLRHTDLGLCGDAIEAQTVRHLVFDLEALADLIVELVMTPTSGPCLGIYL